jgi:CheY-like chemotaxis protein
MLLHPSALVVEDDADCRALLAEYLTFRGFLVAVAATGQEAIAATAPFRPQVVLMNLHLGAGIDGLEATRRLRLTPPAPSSSRSRPGARHRSARRGAMRTVMTCTPSR